MLPSFIFCQVKFSFCRLGIKRMIIMQQSINLTFWEQAQAVFVRRRHAVYCNILPVLSVHFYLVCARSIISLSYRWYKRILHYECILFDYSFRTSTGIGQRGLLKYQLWNFASRMILGLWGTLKRLHANFQPNRLATDRAQQPQSLCSEL